MKNIILILDQFWGQVAGSDEFRRTQWAMTTWIEAKSFENGKAEGVGLWGVGNINWSIDFGSKFDKLEFACGCQAMKDAEKEGKTAPCNHVIRGMIQLEAKLKKESFETIHSNRLHRIIPF